MQARAQLFIVRYDRGPGSLGFYLRVVMESVDGNNGVAICITDLQAVYYGSRAVSVLIR